MKILLTAINAKYIHSNLAVYSLRAYAKEYQEHITLAEYTINQRVDYILRNIYKQKPDVLCISCYIWNIRYVQELVAEIYKVLPGVHIWLGGPEVSYETESFLQDYPMVTGIMVGEGEETFRELCGCYMENKTFGDVSGRGENVKTDRNGVAVKDGKEDGNDVAVKDGKEDGNSGTRKDGFGRIAGLVYRNESGKIERTAKREPVPMDSLPFCYEHPEEFENKIIYYETSRGCPFSCSYCLSSIEKGLRFRSLELVKRELQTFLDHQVKQVKFVDRTFNCNHEHATEIWKYLKEHDNGITNFHFEISADLLTEEELQLISSLRPGQIQLEIGVQSTHEPTIREIHRTMNLSRLESSVEIVRRAGNIHQHLDLIAGLPMEDYETFAKSFREVYKWKPQQLQLGFLKVLKGSYIYEHRADYGLIYQENPPYEIMETKWMSYEEILDIKLVEEMLEVYYNSGQFEMTMKVLELAEENPFYLFLELGRFYERRGLLAVSHSRLGRCEILLDYVREKDKEHLALYQETLTYDLYARENMKTRPHWAPNMAEYKEEARRYGKKGKMSHVEPFFYDMDMIRQEKTLTAYPKKKEARQFYLFLYDGGVRCRKV